MKKFEQTWRWFGPGDPISLSHIAQAGASGVVTALHHVPNGEIWTKQEIQERKLIVEKAGLKWSVVESLPVSEEIKQQTGGWKTHLKNYKMSIRNLSECGIPTVTYNFMPVLDWSRTDLKYRFEDGSTGLRFDPISLAVFDLYILKRKEARHAYTSGQLSKARQKWDGMSRHEQERLVKNILAGLPGSEEGYSLDQFQIALDSYRNIDKSRFRTHLKFFLEEIIPVAEEVKIKMAIHPDDPPYSVLGLPRIASTLEDMITILNMVQNRSHGVCFCAGSFGSRPDNNLTEMVQKMAGRIHFLHLRSVEIDEDGGFYEANHLEGNANMYEIMKVMLKEQQGRDQAIPMRPDHGHKMLDDLGKMTNPGYSAIGRLRGLAELRGLEWGILNSMEEKRK